MVEAILIFLFLLFGHWVADFVCQSNWMAQNKSKSNWPLIVHVCAYSAVMFVFGLAVLVFGVGTLALWAVFALVNGGLHFVTDFFTSRKSSKLYAEGRIHDFFVVIGLDQFLHQAAIAATLLMLIL